MPEIRLASEQLAALNVVMELLGTVPYSDRALFELGEIAAPLRRDLELRREHDTMLGVAVHKVGLPVVRSNQHTGALVRAAIEQAGMELGDPVVDVDIVEDDDV